MIKTLEEELLVTRMLYTTSLEHFQEVVQDPRDEVACSYTCVLACSY